MGAKEDGEEKTGVSDFSLSHGPLRFVTSYSRFHLASDICLTCAKNEASEEGAASSKCVPVKLSEPRHVGCVVSAVFAVTGGEGEDCFSKYDIRWLPCCR